MSLQVWLPLIGNTKNQGLTDYTISMYRGTETYNDNGKLGKCFYANGVNTIKINNIIPDFYNYNGYSLCAWFYIEAQNTVHSGSAIISAGNWNNQVLNLAVSDWSSDHYTNLRVSGTSWSRIYPYNFNKNTWYHVVVSSDGNKTYAYVNGTLIGDTVAGFLPTSIDGDDLCIGGATYYGGMQFFGRINDVRIYNHALSVKEVKELSKGLVAHYSLNGNDKGGDNILTNSAGYNGTSDWGGLVSVGNENGTPYLISKRTDTTTTSRTFVTHSAITSLVSSWATGDKFTISGYYRVPSNETYAVQANMFIRWGASTSTSDTGFYTPSSSVVVKDTWIRFEYTFEVPSYTSGSAVNFYLSAFSQGLSTVHWKYIKMEKGEKATPWMPSSTDAQYSLMGYNDTTIYDSSGYNYHGSINTSQTISSNTARYSMSTNFDGVNNAIKIPFNEMLGLTTAGKTDYTISVWTYKTSIGSKGYQTILGGPSGFELEARSAAETNPVYVAWNWGKNTGSYVFNEWTLFTFVHTTSDNKIYVNGELASSGNAANVPIGDFFIGSWRDVSSQNYQGQMSDFRIYTTALTTDDIKELYQTGASIDNRGNMYSYELREV